MNLKFVPKIPIPSTVRLFPPIPKPFKFDIYLRFWLNVINPSSLISLSINIKLIILDKYNFSKFGTNCKLSAK